MSRNKKEDNDIFYTTMFYGFLLVVGLAITPDVNDISSFVIGIWDGVVTLGVLNAIIELMRELKLKKREK